MDILKKLFSLDTRSLSLFRILIGCIVVADLLSRLTDIPYFYTNTGILLPKYYLELPYQLSFHAFNETLGYQYVLFSLNLVIAFLLIVGFKSNWMMFLLFVFKISANNHASLLLLGPDRVLPLFLLWGTFLPLDGHFFISHLKKKKQDQPSAVHGFFVYIFILQILAIYFIAGMSKVSELWLKDMTVLHFFAYTKAIAMPHTHKLLNLGNFTLKFLTFTTCIFEIISPILYVVFFKRWKIRFLILVGMFLLQAGILLVMNLHLFAAFNMVVLTVLIPKEVWGRSSKYGEYKDENRHLTGAMRPALKMLALAYFLATIFQASLNFEITNNISKRFYANKHVSNFLREIGTFQFWSYFSPRDRHEFVEFDVVAFLKDGSEVYPTGEDFEGIFNEWKLKDGYFRTRSWRNFFLPRVLDQKNLRFKYLARFIVKKWNNRYPPDKHIVNIKVSAKYTTFIPETARLGASRVVMYHDEYF